MGVQATVVFTDLDGSTRVFESLGNARATELVTEITTMIKSQCLGNGGQVIKTLGDGVLAIFPERQNAVNAVVAIQREHAQNLANLDPLTRMSMRIGVATGEVELVDGDCYGDAVNVASRLCNLCGSDRIWANAVTLDGVSEVAGATFRPLGPIAIRGRAEPCSVFQIEWAVEQVSELMTMMHGKLDDAFLAGQADPLGLEIELTWQGQTKCFKSFELPIHIGRVRPAEFMVDDPRVSRTHARLDWRNGAVILVDMSSYGCWVRFSDDTGSEVFLRRQECVLHGKGTLALSASFSDPTVPLVSFVVR